MKILYHKLWENFRAIFPEKYRYFFGNFPTYNPTGDTKRNNNTEVSLQ